MRGFSPSAEKRQLRLRSDGIFCAYYRPLSTLETHFTADRLLGSHRNEFIYREIPFLQHLEHSCANQSRGTYESDFHNFNFTQI